MISSGMDVPTAISLSRNLKAGWPAKLTMRTSSGFRQSFGLSGQASLVPSTQPRSWGVEDALHARMFAAIHTEDQELDDMYKLAANYTAQGIDRSRTETRCITPGIAD